MEDHAPVNRRRFLTEVAAIGCGLLGATTWGFLFRSSDPGDVQAASPSGSPSAGKGRKPAAPPAPKPPKEGDHVPLDGAVPAPRPSRPPSPSPKPRPTPPKEGDRVHTLGRVEYRPPSPPSPRPRR